jgi:hypothetical protein
MEGLWTAEFGSNTGGFGTGVIILRDGKMLGGDASYYYVGEYNFTGNDFRATLTTSPFIEGAESVFKTVGRDLVLDLAGALTEQGQILAKGHPRGMPELNFGVKLTRRT